MKPDPYRLQLNNYPFSIELQTRFGDMDPQAHINNVAIMRLFEESRIRFAFFSREGDFAKLASQMRVVAADLRFSFLREVSYPEPVTVAVGIKHIGNSSYQIGCAMFQKGACVALSDAIVVCSDGQRSQPLPGFVREALQKHFIKGSEVVG
ncbi:MAG: acyl-CoA thioesterase [Spongiibacteraceae bacterium]